MIGVPRCQIPCYFGPYLADATTSPRLTAKNRQEKSTNLKHKQSFAATFSPNRQRAINTSLQLCGRASIVRHVFLTQLGSAACAS